MRVEFRRAACIAAVLSCSPVWADVVNLTADRDATLIQTVCGSPPVTDPANGGEDAFHAGHNAGGCKRRGIVHFNLSSIPVGSVVTAVTVTMRESGSNAANQTVGLHKVLADWGEGTSTGGTGGGAGGAPTTNSVTWAYRFYNTQSWSTAGGQFTATASASRTIGGNASYTWSSTATLVSDVQGWVNSPATNFGWIVKGNESGNSTTKRFDSSEATAANRPTINVTFTPPTGACCLPNGTCSVITQASCTSQSGIYQGNSTTCGAPPCPTPTGACCVGATCSIQTEANCTTMGGTYEGHGTDCSPNPCGGNTTTSFPAAADTTIYSHNQSNSNGAGETIVVGSSFSLIAPTTRYRAGLIRFNLASIPTNAIVSAATLRMTLAYVSDGDGDVISIHRVTRGWGEASSNASGTEVDGAPAALGDATWQHYSYSRGLWTNDGGDFIATVSDTAIVGTTTGVQSSWTSTRVIQDVQGWVNNPSTNFGWEIVGEDSGFTTSLRGFASRTNTSALGTWRPSLLITYSVPEPTGRCCMPSGACLVSTSASCTGMGGVYAGNGTNCATNPCPQPTGSCCLPTGVCVIDTAANCSAQNGVYNGDNTTCAGQDCPIVLTPFIDPLPIPAIATPASGTAGGAAHYNIAMVEFNQQLHSELPPTRVWGYGGTYPGPTIEAFRDQTVTVNWINDLRNSTNPGLGQLRTTHVFPVDTCLHGPDMTGEVPVTVVHLHGAKVAPESDGDPDTAFPPGQQALYTYPNPQAAATMWYHDHALGITRLNVYMGLAGFYLIRDAQENALNLPRGHNEIPLVIQDRSFNPGGSLKYHATLEDNFFGEFMLVNGKVWPYLDVRRGKYRFRIVNGSNSRALTLSLVEDVDPITFHQIGTDLGLKSAPLAINSITLLPAERADIVIDFAQFPAGRELYLVNSAVAPFPSGAPDSVVRNVMKFNITATAGDTDPLPASLVPVPTPDPSLAARTRWLELRNFADAHCPGHPDGTWMINGLLWDDLTELPRENSYEIWSWVNRSTFTHPMHIHLVRFQILDRQAFSIVNNQVVPNGPLIPPDPTEIGWKDTVQATPNQITRVIARFEGFRGIFPYHCHLLEHEDHEMMRKFQVVCTADFDDGTGTGIPDGGVTIDDLLYYLAIFEAGDPVADVDDGTGTGTPDGGVTIDDLLYYLFRFEAGC